MNNNFVLNLNTIKKAQKFNDICITYDCDIDILRGRYVIDAKSILGIFSLDLDVPVEVYIHSNDEYVLSKFNEEMKEFV